MTNRFGSNSPPSPRFSKAALVDALRARIDVLNEGYDFDPRNGWQQVHRKGPAENRAYGAWNELVTLVEQIEDGSFP